MWEWHMDTLHWTPVRDFQTAGGHRLVGPLPPLIFLLTLSSCSTQSTCRAKAVKACMHEQHVSKPRMLCTCCCKPPLVLSPCIQWHSFAHQRRLALGVCSVLAHGIINLKDDPAASSSSMHTLTLYFGDQLSPVFKEINDSPHSMQLPMLSCSGVCILH